MTATGEQAAAARWDEARSLVERGDLPAAERRFAEVVAQAEPKLRARAAIGLAAVRDDLGDVAGADDADEVAIATGDPRYAPRAAYHLALRHDEAGDDEAAAAWQRVLDFDDQDYLPRAHLALGYLADAAGDDKAARTHWQATVASRDARCRVTAAQELAGRLSAEGAHTEAARLLEDVIVECDPGSDSDTDQASLWTALSIVRLEQAVAALGAVVDTGDPDVAPLAVELLARTLPLRGRDEDAARVWEHGLAHQDPRVAGDVQARLRRGFGDSGTETPPWWDRYLAAAAQEGTLAQLAGELFAAVDQSHAEAAAGYLAGRRQTGEARAALRRAIGVPDRYLWGGDLYAGFLDRLRDDDTADPPEQWPPR